MFSWYKEPNKCIRIILENRVSSIKAKMHIYEKTQYKEEHLKDFNIYCSQENHLTIWIMKHSFFVIRVTYWTVVSIKNKNVYKK